MKFDEDSLLQEPCLSCTKAYVENIWHEWCCKERECPYTAESEGKKWILPNRSKKK